MQSLKMSSVEQLSAHFVKVRRNTESLANLFSYDDWMLQSMMDVSPIKWNIAHTSWFFETFLLSPYRDGYRKFDETFGYLFNSYYNAVGDRIARHERGLISRPSADQVVRYRRYVTDNVIDLLSGISDDEVLKKIATLVVIGCAHEEQHQELLLTDVQHAFSRLPVSPKIFSGCTTSDQKAPECSVKKKQWVAFEGGVSEIGVDFQNPIGGFAFDNEGPKHQVFISPFALSSDPVTNREFLMFIDEGGYRDPAFWLSDGWDFVTREGWHAPLYWRQKNDRWVEHSLYGEQPLDLDAPVAHVSYFEAAAYAEWSGFRLPTEFEWETASKGYARQGNLLQDAMPQPIAAGPIVTESSAQSIRQLYGDVWEWTASPYVAYPGYRTPAGAIGEYNGKFMSSQMVLKGGSHFTPKGHIRNTYRNFFPPGARWQVSGLRLAKDLQ